MGGRVLEPSFTWGNASWNPHLHGGKGTVAFFALMLALFSHFFAFYKRLNSSLHFLTFFFFDFSLIFGRFGKDLGRVWG